MFLATVNPAKQLLYLSYLGKVGVAELQRGIQDLEGLLADLTDGFRILADLSRLDSMDIACVPEIGRTMELLERRRVGLIVRVIPDPTKDIGMNIIAAFHYHNRPRMATCATMDEAARALAL